ncbi:MAG TPA: hypothetical protein VJV22_10995 [Acidobacteriaceae bacterium]|nr:hypothetical protein [Acidobacteriaceae bacterium]
MDRIISGHCECCETFAFQVRSSGSRRIEQLDEVVLNYSARDKEHLVSAARKIGAAIGMSPTDLATIGSANEQNFHWNTITGNHREISAAEVRLSHRGQGWELFLNWGRNLDEPSNGNSP